MGHRDAPLLRGDGRERQDTRDVTGRVDAAHRRARDAVDLDVPRAGELDTDLLEAEARGRRDRADGHEHVRTLDDAPVGERHLDVLVVPGPDDARGLGPRARHHGHAAVAEDLLDEVRGVGVLAGQDPVARGDERHGHTERVVGPRELGTGDARADDDEVRGQLGELVELRPREDAPTVGLRVGQLARGRADGDEDDVRVVRRDGAVVGRHLDPRRRHESSRSGDEPHTLTLEARADVGRLRERELAHAGVDAAEVDARAEGSGLGVLTLGGERDAELGRSLGDRHPVGRRDERLRRDDVGEDGGAAEAAAFDERDIGAEAPRDEGGLVAAGAAADDRHGRGLEVLLIVCHGDHRATMRTPVRACARRAGQMVMVTA